MEMKTWLPGILENRRSATKYLPHGQRDCSLSISGRGPDWLTLTTESALRQGGLRQRPLIVVDSNY